MDRNIIEDLLKKSQDSLKKGELQKMCIFFMDIRNFTTLTSTRKSEAVVTLLNLVFENTTRNIINNGGFVNKFMGDGVLAFFGTDDNPSDHAVLASIQILKNLEEMNENGSIHDLVGDWDLNIGIGLHYGEVIVGNIGSERKMDFTIIGNAVNVTSRIEELTKKVLRPLLLSENVFLMLTDKRQFENLGKFDIRGISDSMNIYGYQQQKVEIPPSDTDSQKKKQVM